jgi:hypothetical protein
VYEHKYDTLSKVQHEGAVRNSEKNETDFREKTMWTTSAEVTRRDDSIEEKLQAHPNSLMPRSTIPARSHKLRTRKPSDPSQVAAQTLGVIFPSQSELCWNKVTPL